VIFGAAGEPWSLVNGNCSKLGSSDQGETPVMAVTYSSDCLHKVVTGKQVKLVPKSKEGMV